MNKVILMGRLTADPERKVTPGGTAVASFSIAVSRDHKNKDGGYDTDFISVVAWKQTAEFLCQYFRKGKPVLLEGRLQARSYEDKQGIRRHVTEVVAEKARFVLSDGSGGMSSPSSGKAPESSVDSLEGYEIIGDEDLPF